MISKIKSGIYNEADTCATIKNLDVLAYQGHKVYSNSEKLSLAILPIIWPQEKLEEVNIDFV